MRRAALALATCCILALAACGKDDSSSDGDNGSQSTTERAWAKRVNSACRKNNAAVKKLVDQVSSEGLKRNEFVAEGLERSIPQSRRGLARLRTVEAPAPLQTEYKRFIDRLEDALPLTERVAKSARTGREDPGLNEQLREVADDTRPFAKTHGFTDCLG